MRKSLPILLISLTAFPALVWAGDEKTLAVESFDGNGPKLGTEWLTYLDENKLGTKVNPFAIVKDGSPKGSKGHGHFSGHMGKSKDPWPWAVLDLGFGDNGPKDLSAYTHLRFYAKGDGKKYRVRLGRDAVKDYCDFEYTFVAPKKWTSINAPLAEFTQPKWGKQIPRGFKDVNKIGFIALAPGDDEDFELRFTDVEFVAKAATKGK
jgi:Complex I intermediate-associated protein 30 (CIA30)